MRHREDTGFEAKCLYCGEWWPITLEYWKPRGGMARCKACWTLYHRMHEAGRRLDEFVVEAKRQAERIRYRTHRPARLTANLAWKAAHKEHIRAYNKAYRAKNREAGLARNAVYYAEAREAILFKKRLAYRERTSG